MANPQNSPPKSKLPETKRVASVETDAAPQASGAVSAEPAPVIIEAQKPSIASAPSTALAVAVEIKSAGAEEFDPALWSQKSIDLWAENATAVLDFAERLAKAKTLDEVTNLQSHFMSERFDTLLRHSNELLSLTQRMFTVSLAPLYGARAA
ncbi:phasin family protein [Methylocystis sp. B8]|uniref:phasin family protein n=1 Tax=Methylocystis sp. B8 TaxID=544938 RepID=UPI0010FE6EE3|nr:phasin family protein [Methylocystis sp. B8]TLG77729.1 hypothetical protein FEV16_07840 [Methylocystis sp. B8]